MTATNHALFGAVIGASISQPQLAIPLAFASHFLLDAIPHFGLDDFGGHLNAKKQFHRVLYVDALLLACVFILLLLLSAPHLVFICAILAGSADFLWAYRYIVKEHLGKIKPSPKSHFSRFHSKIQTSQTLNGIFIELPLAVILTSVIIILL